MCVVHTHGKLSFHSSNDGDGEWVLLEGNGTVIPSSDIQILNEGLADAANEDDEKSSIATLESVQVPQILDQQSDASTINSRLVPIGGDIQPIDSQNDMEFKVSSLSQLYV